MKSKNNFSKQLIARYPVALTAADLLAAAGEDAPVP
jgi:hypothetical protein